MRLNTANSCVSCCVPGDISVSFFDTSYTCMMSIVEEPNAQNTGENGNVTAFWMSPLIAFGMRGAGAAAHKQNKIFGTVSAQMNFFHDRRRHIAVDDLADEHRRFFDRIPNGFAILSRIACIARFLSSFIRPPE